MKGIKNTFFIFLGFSSVPSMARSEIKETHQIISEWVDTENLISEESVKWNAEKSALIDINSALVSEIAELDNKLQSSENEISGAEQQRVKLMERKDGAEQNIKILSQKMSTIQRELEKVFTLLPSPLASKLSPFLEKLNNSENGREQPLGERVEASVSLLQAIHLFHRTVSLERQEFTLDEEQSREFLVLYFGLGCAYFVNESGTVSGYGVPSRDGWKWTRKDDLAIEVSTGVEMVKNRTMPRFLKLPIPVPDRVNP